MFPNGAGKSLSPTPTLAEFQVRPDNPTTASVLIRRVQTSGGSNQGIERFAFAVTLADLKCGCCLEGVQRLWSSTFSIELDDRVEALLKQLRHLESKKEQ
jgi:hypothetical protein